MSLDLVEPDADGIGDTQPLQYTRPPEELHQRREYHIDNDRHKNEQENQPDGDHRAKDAGRLTFRCPQQEGGKSQPKQQNESDSDGQCNHQFDQKEPPGRTRPTNPETLSNGVFLPRFFILVNHPDQSIGRHIVRHGEDDTQEQECAGQPNANGNDGRLSLFRKLRPGRDFEFTFPGGLPAVSIPAVVCCIAASPATAGRRQRDDDPKDPQRPIIPHSLERPFQNFDMIHLCTSPGHSFCSLYLF